MWARGRIQARETVHRAENNLNDYQAQGLWHHRFYGTGLQPFSLCSSHLLGRCPRLIWSAPSALILCDSPMILICIIPRVLTNISGLTDWCTKQRLPR